MLKSTEEFVCFLNQNNLKYCLDGINANDNEQITMCITSQTMSDITIHFLFDSNNQIVYIRIWNLLKIPDQFNSIALTIINELNNTYRFVRFYLNTDNGIDVFVDSLIHSGTIGKTCINLGIVIAKICDTVIFNRKQKFLHKAKSLLSIFLMQVYFTTSNLLFLLQIQSVSISE